MGVAIGSIAILKTILASPSLNHELYTSYSIMSAIFVGAFDFGDYDGNGMILGIGGTLT